MDPATVAVAVMCALAMMHVLTRCVRTRLPYPPGPPEDPIIGHLRQMPNNDEAAEVWYRWAKQYGDVMSLNVLGKRLVILSSEEAATELLEKRSSKYADRPRFPIFERIGWKDMVLLMPYGPYHKTLRKMIQVPFEKDKAFQFRDVQERATSIMLHNFLADPKGIEHHTHWYVVSIIVEIVFGHRILSEDDEHLKIADVFVKIQHEASQPSLLDVSPLFAKLPSWFPGAWFIKYIEDTKAILSHVIHHPVSLVQEQLASGIAKPSFVADELDRLIKAGQLTPQNKYDVSIAAHMIFGGGTETTWNTLTTFIACMLLNPEAQRKAQEEIDKVVGHGRLPDFTDRDSLPYVECVVKETMRWHPVAPVAVPHKATEDDVYRGMYIPKGAIVIANARSITWDERRFHDPHAFKPERFLPRPLGAGEDFVQGAVYGWGRRICPGRHLAGDMVWIAIARVLAVFDIQKARDADGNAIEPNIEFTTAVSSHPKPFPCELRPRSEKAASLIKESYELHSID
uniref:Cytochrome P450 n=1 Tax=Phanerodontia chrysosporium TaxID=2822231 RepID=G5EJT8_PHACH|nr:cytochrome P450 [Phanerodontia chrysosporium]